MHKAFWKGASAEKAGIRGGGVQQHNWPAAALAKSRLTLSEIHNTIINNNNNNNKNSRMFGVQPHSLLLIGSSPHVETSIKRT